MTSVNNLESLQNILKLYKENNYSFDEPDNLKCLLCRQILLNAVQTSCGCRYCKECIDEYLKGNKKCLTPECDDIDCYVADKAIIKEIGKIEINCFSEGCSYKSQLKDIKKHIDMCGFQSIKCPECNETCSKKGLTDHLENSCMMRKVKCEYCEKYMNAKEKEENHYNIDKQEICSNYYDFCPYKCDIIDTVNISNHRNECKNRPISCLFSDVGCVMPVTKDSYDNHIREDINHHSTILIKEIQKLKQEIIQLKFENDNFKKNHDEVLRELSEMKLKLLELSYNSNSNTVLSITNAFKDKTVFRSGIYIWKIENFQILKLNAENGNKISITSDPFYTREFGYKMSMKIYPAGDGVGKNTHLSVFFTIMRGEFDNLLPWPFKNKVTLSILDQKNKAHDHSDTFKPDSRSTCYQQPTEEYNIASGSPKFITFTDLFEKYLHQDMIFLKIQVIN